MVDFQYNDPSLESQWRAIILFGKNSATYKFAFAKALLEVIEKQKDLVHLSDLARPFALSIVEHLKNVDKQGSSNSSKFLEVCRDFRDGKLKEDELFLKTEQLGFGDVVSAFQIVNNEVIPNPFYETDKSNKKKLIITDNLLSLKEKFQFENFENEVEARWRLVETAWSLNIPAKVLEVKNDEDCNSLIIESNSMRRIDITPVRDALNGYQKGKCFYSGLDISIQKNHQNVCEVDHFFPHINKLEHLKHGANINGVWNLVLSDASVNLKKMTKIPNLIMLEKLYNRNEYYIKSNLPLAETIINQTGKNPEERKKFLQKQFDIAVSNSIHVWNPKF